MYDVSTPDALKSKEIAWQIYLNILSLRDRLWR